MGRYRQARGEGELERVRAEAHAAIVAQRKAADPELSQRWRGVAAPYRPGHGGVPVWVALAGAAALCGGLLFWASTSLNAASDRLQAQVLASLARAHAAGDARGDRASRCRRRPRRPNRPRSIGCAPACSRTSTGARSACWARRRRRSSASPTTRCSHRAARSCRPRRCRCWSGSPRRCGTRRGSLRVIDYTDNQPVRTVQFPSNFQLSTARANAVRAIIARSCRRSGAGQRGGPRRCRPDRTQHHRRGPRTEPADRDRAAPPGLTASVTPASSTVLDARAGASASSGLPCSRASCGSSRRCCRASRTGRPRLAVIVALLLVWGGGNALLDIRRRRRDAALAQGIAASTEETEEAQALRTRLTTALDLLKTSLAQPRLSV